jgi:hypothetical protein
MTWRPLAENNDHLKKRESVMKSLKRLLTDSFDIAATLTR